MPCATPPSICPAASIGLMTFPISCTSDKIVHAHLGRAHVHGNFGDVNWPRRRRCKRLPDRSRRPSANRAGARISRTTSAARTARCIAGRRPQNCWRHILASAIRCATAFRAWHVLPIPRALQRSSLFATQPSVRCWERPPCPAGRFQFDRTRSPALRGNLCEYGVRALTHLRAPSQYAHAALRSRFQIGLGGQIFLAGTRESGAVEKGREPYAFLDRSVGIFVLETGALGMVVAQVERACQQACQVDLFAHDLTEREGVAFAKKVPAAQFVRRESDCLPPPDPDAAPARKRFAGRRNREKPRAEERSSPPRGCECARWDSCKALQRESSRAKVLPAKAFRTRRHRW